MKAIAIEPKKPGTARFEDIPEPDVHEGSVLVEAVAVGVCRYALPERTAHRRGPFCASREQ